MLANEQPCEFEYSAKAIESAARRGRFAGLDLVALEVGDVMGLLTEMIASSSNVRQVRRS